MTHPIERPSYEDWFLIADTEWAPDPVPRPELEPHFYAIGEMRESAEEGEDWRSFLDHLRAGWHLDYHEWHSEDNGGSVAFGAVVLCVYHPAVADELEAKFGFERIADRSDTGIWGQIVKNTEAHARKTA